MRWPTSFFILALLLAGYARAEVLPIYEPPKRADYLQAAEAFKSVQLLEQVAAAINRTVRVPVKMPLVLRECGMVNAYYAPAERSIYLCYELMEHVVTGITKEASSTPPEARMDTAFGALFFILFHEVGHGLSHILRLPILGKEEDAADSIATYLVLGLREPAPAIAGTLWFFGTGSRTPSLQEYADEHSLGPQRQFSLVCYAVGKDATQFRLLAEKLRLPLERAARCPAEYQQLRRSVRQLLGTHLR
jgi:hypothetical protein